MGKWLDGVASHDLMQSAGKWAKKAGWNGTIEEFMEEQVGIGLNALLTGDSQWSDYVDGQQQLETLLQVAVMGGAINGFNTGAAQIQKGNIKRRYDRADSELDKAFGNTLEGSTAAMKLRQTAANGSLDDLNHYLNRLASAVKEGVPQYNRDQMDAATAYAVAATNYNAMIGSIRNRVDGVVNERMEVLKERSNPDMGAVVEGYRNKNEAPIWIVGGNVVLNDGGGIDYEKSSETLYQRDSSGKVKPISIELLESATVTPLSDVDAELARFRDGLLQAEAEGIERVATEREDGKSVVGSVSEIGGKRYVMTELFDNDRVLAIPEDGIGETIEVPVEVWRNGGVGDVYSENLTKAHTPDVPERPENTPRSLAQATKEVLNIDRNEQAGSDVSDDRTSTGQRGRQRSTEEHQAGKRVEKRERTADSAGGIEAKSTTGEAFIHKFQSGRKGVEQNSDGGRQEDSADVADNAAKEMVRLGDRDNIRMFEEEMASTHGAHSNDSEGDRRKAESERVISIAKKHNLYVPIEFTQSLTGKVAKRTDDSVVYVDNAGKKVVKVKNPYAKSAIKSGIQPEDAFYEHIVHNLLFPETKYTFEGISEESGDVRIILSQNYIPTYGQPTKEQITKALAAKELFREDKYSFGNELVSVTNVEGDNVLLGEDGSVYFIDPIIGFKRPVQEIIAALNGMGKRKTGNKKSNTNHENKVSLQRQNEKSYATVSESVSQGERRAQDAEDEGMERAERAIRRSQSSRADETQSGGGQPALSRQEVEARAAEAYAKESGSWIPLNKVFELGRPRPSGNEVDTYVGNDGYIYKVNNLMNSKGILPLFERIKLHNQTFPSTKYEFVGFTGFEGRSIYPVFKQRYIQSSSNATPEEIAEYMGALGFSKVNDHEFSNGRITVSDLRPRNVLKDSEGNLYVVDAELTGNLTIAEHGDDISRKMLGENGMTAEESRIVENAKANGTYLKAPNGKRSHLSEKEWVQVRTEAFKAWFGDWEKGFRRLYASVGKVRKKS